MNSYGNTWGYDGYFRVQNAEVINAKLMEINIEPYNYTEEQKDKFEEVVTKADKKWGKICLKIMI